MTNTRYYRGPSMSGTFRPGDRLHYTPTPISRIGRGDVVIFMVRKGNGKAEYPVHRVVSKIPGGLITRGDNNSGIDKLPVLPGDIMGIVTHLDRKGKKRPVHGGFRGVFRSTFLHARFPLKRILKFFLKKPYNAVKRSGIISTLWHPVLKKATFNTPKGPLIKYLYRGRTIAYWWPRQGLFHCKKPFDLILRPPCSADSKDRD